MSFTILKKEHTRLRVKEVQLPLATSEVLGSGIDVMSLPEGHLTCAKCHSHLFECWVYLDAHRLEMGCQNCGYSYRLLFPYDIPLSPFRNQGRFTCKRHPESGMILIHNVDVISVGCEKCFSEVQIKLRNSNNIVIADA